MSPTVYEKLDMVAMEKTALEAAEQSITLLINQRREGEAAPALPLPADWAGIKSVLLAGPLADDSNSMQGERCTVNCLLLVFYNKPSALNARWLLPRGALPLRRLWCRCWW